MWWNDGPGVESGLGRQRAAGRAAGRAAAESAASGYPWRTTVKRVSRVTYELQVFMRLTLLFDLYIVYSVEVAFYRDQLSQQVDFNH